MGILGWVLLFTAVWLVNTVAVAFAVLSISRRQPLTVSKTAMPSPAGQPDANGDLLREIVRAMVLPEHMPNLNAGQVTADPAELRRLAAELASSGDQWTEPLFDLTPDPTDALLPNDRVDVLAGPGEPPWTEWTDGNTDTATGGAVA